MALRIEVLRTEFSPDFSHRSRFSLDQVVQKSTFCIIYTIKERLMTPQAEWENVSRNEK